MSIMVSEKMIKLPEQRQDEKQWNVYYICRNSGKIIRVPKGKGKIEIIWKTVGFIPAVFC